MNFDLNNDVSNQSNQNIMNKRSINNLLLNKIKMTFYCLIVLIGLFDWKENEIVINSVSYREIIFSVLIYNSNCRIFQKNVSYSFLIHNIEDFNFFLIWIF